MPIIPGITGRARPILDFKRPLNGANAANTRLAGSFAEKASAQRRSPIGSLVTCFKALSERVKYVVSPLGLRTDMKMRSDKAAAAAADPWSRMHQKSYPKPASADDVFGKNASPKLRADFAGYMAIHQHTPENFGFLDSLKSLSNQPSIPFAKFDALRKTFFEPGAEMELNFGRDASDIADAIDRIKAMTPSEWSAMSHAEQVALFEPVRRGTENLIWTNSPAFLKAEAGQF